MSRGSVPRVDGRGTQTWEGTIRATCGSPPLQESSAGQGPPLFEKVLEEAVPTATGPCALCRWLCWGQCEAGSSWGLRGKAGSQSSFFHAT